MDVRERVRSLMASPKGEDHIDKFLSDVRDSLAVTNRQFIAYEALIIASIVSYHLVVYEGSAVVSINHLKISDPTFFRRIFLVFPSALLAAVAAIGYLRRLQREVYDYVSISRFRHLGRTGLHELRLPPDYILGLFVLQTEGGRLGLIVSRLVAFLAFVSFVMAPVGYVLNEAIKNVIFFGVGDWLCLGASCVSIVLCACSLLIVRISGSIKA